MAPKSPTGTRRVFVHVGAPLGASAQLAEYLARNRRRLARSGVLYPSTHVGGTGGHRDAVLDLLGEAGAATRRRADGAWDRLAEASRDWRRGTVVVSDERLAGARAEQRSRLVASLGSAEVHVVYVACDLGRQLPLAWQDWVLRGGTATFSSYVDKVSRRDAHRLARTFWRGHDLGAVLERWATVVPTERVHVLTAPGGADEPRVLWDRFATLLGLDPTRFRPVVPARRPPLALTGLEAARLVNTRPGAHTALPLGVVRGPAPALPPELAGWLAGQADGTIQTVKAAGYDVVGDVTELRPDPAAIATDPDQVLPATTDVVRAQTDLLHVLAAEPGGGGGGSVRGVFRRGRRG